MMQGRVLPLTFFGAGIGLLAYAILSFAYHSGALNPYPKDQTQEIAQASAGVNLAAAPHISEMQILENAVAAGDPIAQNNLALILLRTRGQANKERAADLLEKAAAQNLVQARYNIAYRLPYRFDTDPAIVQRQIDLLQANVAAGDPHSMALLFARLGFTNRDAYVLNREAYRRTLIEGAALTGDPDYIVTRAKYLLDVARSGDPAIYPDAVAALLEAHKTGDPRVPHAISFAVRNHPDEVGPLLVAASQSDDPFDWMQRAADAGSRPSQCSYGLHALRPLRNFHVDPPNHARGRLERNIAFHALPHDMKDRAIDYLEGCIEPAPSKSRGSTAFGDDALYIRKYRGTWPSMANSRGHAHMTIGGIAAFGVGQTADPKRARASFDRALTEEDWSDAARQLVILENLF